MDATATAAHDVHCEEVGRAIEVGLIHWQAGTVEYEGATFDGVAGEATFTVPQVGVDTYRLAESTDATGTGCHIFTVIEVVAELPDTALPVDPASAADPAPVLALASAAWLLTLAAWPTGSGLQARPAAWQPDPDPSPEAARAP